MNKATACCATELVGTFALTFIGAGSIITTQLTGHPDLVVVALAHGFVLAIVASAALNVSGGHINPAVTLTMLATGRIKGPLALGYIVSQLVGATVAGLLLNLIFRSLGDVGLKAMNECLLGTPALHDSLPAVMGLVVEIALTFLLVFAIFGTAVDPRAPKIGGFGIGLAVCVDILMGGPLTGAAMNPARTFGTLLGGGAITSELWSQHWIYWGGPLIGGLLAGFLYDTLIMPKESR